MTKNTNAMAKPDNAWFNYWNKKNIWSDSGLWRKQMETFVRLSSELMGYDKNDKVLDFGCGSGHFAEIAADRIGAIVCADMSEHYVSICKQKFAVNPHISVVRVAPDMSDLSVVGSGFTKVVCLSVLHYFAQLDHVAAFVKGMQQVCAPGAKLLIADIGNEHRTWKDVVKTLTFTLREGMLLDVAGMTAKMWWVDPHYRKIKQSGKSYLAIPDGYFRTLGHELGIKVTNLDTQFTVNANYKNVLIEF